MRKSLILGFTTAILMICAGAARADKTAQALIDPLYVSGSPSPTGFINASNTCSPPPGTCVKNVPTVGSVKQSGCKLKILIKGLTLFADLEEMICLAGADACIANPGIPCGAGFGNTVVARVPFSTLTLKAQTKADFTDIGCGATNATATNTSMRCYRDDLAYDPELLCSGSLGLWTNNDTFVPATPATDGLVGHCQYFTPGTRLAPPATALVARDGVSTPQTIPPPAP
jgi:hypothetical protein